LRSAFIKHTSRCRRCHQKCNFALSATFFSFYATCENSTHTVRIHESTSTRRTEILFWMMERKESASNRRELLYGVQDQKSTLSAAEKGQRVYGFCAHACDGSVFVRYRGRKREGLSHSTRSESVLFGFFLFPIHQLLVLIEKACKLRLARKNCQDSMLV
jgi:hypothetical protein